LKSSWMLYTQDC